DQNTRRGNTCACDRPPGDLRQRDEGPNRISIPTLDRCKVEGVWSGAALTHTTTTITTRERKLFWLSKVNSRNVSKVKVQE
nr:hypothetical protein [Tanacetum cinerariifolium]